MVPRSNKLPFMESSLLFGSAKSTKKIPQPFKEHHCIIHNTIHLSIEFTK
jgi:hypothetical protein